jgi:hypothetical protein
MGPKCPRDYLPAERCQQVYDGVWVFEDFD